MNPPSWLDYLTAFGTAGAALFAAWASFVGQSASRSARLSAEASYDLMELEKSRDAREIEEKALTAARSIVVSIAQRPFNVGSNMAGIDFCLTLRNAGLVPVFETLLQVRSADAIWGPQPIGSVAPGDSIEAYAHLPCSNTNDTLDASVLFRDRYGRQWLAAPSGGLDEVGISFRLDWVTRSETFASALLPRERRGRIKGLVGQADFETWRRSMAPKGAGE